MRHEASGRSASYGELAADAAKIALAVEPAIKAPEHFELIGLPMKRFDTPLKVTGAARFGIDARLPGMAYAAVANCPVFGGALKSYDFSAISNRRGIIAAVPVTNGVAVVADNFWRAKEALAAMPVEWEFGLAASTDSTQFRAEYRAALDGPLADGGGHGDVGAAFASPARRIEALYEVPYLAHAPMEPLNATVHWRPDRIDVWMGTQSPETAIALAAKAGGVDPQGRLHPQRLSRRRLRPARDQRRAHAGRDGFQGRTAPGEADLDPRAGHPRRPLPSAGGAVDARGAEGRRRAGGTSSSPPPSARSPGRSAGAGS